VSGTRRLQFAVRFLLALVLLPASATAQTTLSGQAHDPAGRPLSGVRVWVLLHGDWDGSEKPDTVTGDDGTFTIDGIPPRTGVVLALCGADASADPIDLKEIPEEPVDLVLQPTGRITGRIVDLDGAPVAGAAVQLIREPRVWGAACSLALPLPCDPQDSGQTDADGNFALAGLKAGVYALQAEAAGFAGHELRGVRLHAGEVVAGLEVVLDPHPGELRHSVAVPGPEVRSGGRQDVRTDRGLVVRGQFPGLDPDEVPRVRVLRGSTVREGEADPDGGYFVTGLTPGRWMVSAELHAEETWNGFRSAVGQITLQEGDDETVLDLDFALGDASLTVQAPAGEKILIASLVRPDGSILFTSGMAESPTVRFDRLRPGTYHLVWSLGENGERRGEQDVTVSTDGEVTLTPESQSPGPPR
jgi:hypothetical protein